MPTDSNPIRLSPDPFNYWIDRMYLQDAYKAALHSTDVNTQVGCVLVVPYQGVLLSSWNAVPDRILKSGFPCNKETKNFCTEHAERNILYKALENRLPTTGLTLYSTWAACSDCSRAIIGCGISRVVTLSRLVERTPERWRETVENGIEMMYFAGVKVVGWSGDLGVTEKLRFSGETIENKDLM